MEKRTWRSGLKTLGGLHQSDGAFLHQISDRQTVISEFRRGADHQPHISEDQLVQCRLVLLVSPLIGELKLAFPRKKGGIHGNSDELATGVSRGWSLYIRHLLTL